MAKLKESLEPLRTELAPRIIAHMQTATGKLFEFEELRKATLSGSEPQSGQFMAAAAEALISVGIFTFVVNSMVERNEIERHEVEKEEGSARHPRKVKKVAYSVRT